MNKPAAFIVVATLLLFSLPQAACSVERDAPDSPDARQLENESPKRILFVGNSYLYYNDSLHNHVERIADEAGPHEAGEYQFKSATIGGARLSHHPIDTLLEPGRLGVDEPFELVIIQGASDETLSEESRATCRFSNVTASKLDQNL